MVIQGGSSRGGENWLDSGSKVELTRLLRDEIWEGAVQDDSESQSLSNWKGKAALNKKD